MKYLIIGSAIAGNKGAAGMLEALVQTIGHRDKNAEFTLLSMYPKADKRRNSYKNLKIIPTKPLVLGLIVNPLSLLYKILPPLRPLLKKQQHISAILDCDIFLDQGGITFVDGRELFLLYNVASILPPLLLNKKVIKCSQAMGTFNKFLNRNAAKLILPRVTLILARGDRTYSYLMGLKLKNVIQAADYAFSLELEQKEIDTAKEILKQHNVKKDEDYIGVCPSQVVKKKCLRLDIPYEQLTASFIDKLAKDGHKVLLFSHSAKENSESLHNNDLPLTRAIYQLVKNKKQCVLIDEELSPQQLRYIISTMKLCILSRFHAMVSALSVGTPVIVVGWSHKYREVLSSFSQEQYTIDLSALKSNQLMKLSHRVMENEAAIRQQLASKIEVVKQSSMLNADEIIKHAQPEVVSTS